MRAISLGKMRSIDTVEGNGELVIANAVGTLKCLPLSRIESLGQLWGLIGRKSQQSTLMVEQTKIVQVAIADADGMSWN